MSKIEVCPIQGGGPEDVLTLPDGSVITGTMDGRIQRITADFQSAETVCDTGRRPLGMTLAPNGDVVFCDPEAGVFAVDLDTGDVRAIAAECDGAPLRLSNNPSVAADGTVYFSTSSERNSVAEATKDIVEGIPTGRLCRCGPDGVVQVLKDGLLFANGVAVAPDQQSVLVAETGRSSITRVWIDGPKAGRSEVFAENMAGMPDNLRVTEDGTLLVAWVQPTRDDLAKIAALPYFLRWVIVRLPAFLVPKPSDDFMVGRYDFDGNLLGSVSLTGAGYHFVTGVCQSEDWVYVGSIEEDAVARFPFAALAE